MTTSRNYYIEMRYLVAGEGWKLETINLGTDLQRASASASSAARELDARFADDHFWTVDLKGEHGSYCQLFHGRLS